MGFTTTLMCETEPRGIVSNEIVSTEGVNRKGWMKYKGKGL